MTDFAPPDPEERRVYFDVDDYWSDGHGWNCVTPYGIIACRYTTKHGALLEACHDVEWERG